MEDEEAELEDGPVLLRQLRSVAVRVSPADQVHHHAQQKWVLGPREVLKRLLSPIHADGQPAISNGQTVIPSVDSSSVSRFRFRHTMR